MIASRLVRQWRSAAKEVVGHSVLFVQFISVTETYICSPTLVLSTFCFFAPSSIIPKSISGPSMLPTLNFTGDVLLVEKLSHRLGKVGPGDVILVRSPDNPMKAITKRVVGLEGHTVSFLEGHHERSQSLVVPKGHVWIQGDNIYASKDSRQLGPIPYGLILGKVWPPQDFGRLGQ